MTTSTTKPYDAEEIEAARKLFEGPWDFVWASTKIDDLPPMVGQEIAFAGRSNVGKSSLINALTRRNALARTSHTPGRTQQLNFFRQVGHDERLTIVDMPGYGYAEAPKEKVDIWNELIRDYLRGRVNLRRVYMLIDARHGIKKNDEDVMVLLDKAAVSYQIVLTKTDKLKAPGVAKLIEETSQRILRRPAAYPIVLATSSEKGDGLDSLRAAIAELVP